MEFERILSWDRSDPNAVTVTLYRDTANDCVRAWYVGPVRYTADGVEIPYAKRSDRVPGVLALVRAHKIALELGTSVYVFDPNNLWPLISED